MGLITATWGEILQFVLAAYGLYYAVIITHDLVKSPARWGEKKASTVNLASMTAYNEPVEVSEEMVAARSTPSFTTIAQEADEQVPLVNFSS